MFCGCLSAPVTSLPAVIVTFAMLPCCSSSRYCVYVIVFADSDFCPDSWISTTGMRMMRIQKDTVLENRPQLNSFFGFGELVTGIYCKLAIYGMCRKFSA